MKNKKIKLVTVLIVLVILAIVAYCCSNQNNNAEYDSKISDIATQNGYIYKEKMVISNQDVYSYVLSEEKSDVKILIEIYHSNIDASDDVFITAINEIESLDESVCSLLPHAKVMSDLTVSLSSTSFSENTLVDFLKANQKSEFEKIEEYIIKGKTMEGNGYLIQYEIIEESKFFGTELVEYFSISI